MSRRPPTRWRPPAARPAGSGALAWLVAACSACAAPIALAGLVAACAAPAAAPPASLRFALDTDQCAAYCAETLRATLYRDGDLFPLGPAAQVPCGEPLVFAALPAGHRVYARVEVLDFAGAPLLAGTSAVVTIAADASVDAEVPLAALTPPRLDAVAPDPVVPGADAVALTLSGAAFGEPGGAFGVELDGAPLVTTTWADDEVVAALGPEDHGAAVVVRRCGVASAPRPLRVVARTAPATAALALAPGCPGRRFVALAAHGEDVLAAVRCDDPAASHLQRFTAGASCPPAVAQAWPLGVSPVDLSVAHGVAWVALDDGEVAAVPLADRAAPDAVSAPLSEGVAAVAVEATGSGAPGAGRVFAIGRSAAGARLYELLPAGGPAAWVPNVDAALDLTDLASDAARLYAVASAPGDVGKLVAVPLAGGTISEWSLDDCAHPVHVATGSGAWVAVACDEDDGARVLGFAPDTLIQVAVAWPDAGAPTAIALDAVGDVALAWAPGGAHLVALAPDGARTLATWATVDAGAGVRLGALHHFMIASSSLGELSVIGPYAGGDLCDAQ